jgi:hypothetical protein
MSRYEVRSGEHRPLRKNEKFCDSELGADKPTAPPGELMQPDVMQAAREETFGPVASLVVAAGLARSGRYTSKWTLVFWAKLALDRR